MTETLEARSAKGAETRGSEPVGPSDDHMALLRGEITSAEYVRRLKARVDARLDMSSVERAS